MLTYGSIGLKHATHDIKGHIPVLITVDRHSFRTNSKYDNQTYVGCNVVVQYLFINVGRCIIVRICPVHRDILYVDASFAAKYTIQAGHSSNIVLGTTLSKRKNTV